LNPHEKDHRGLMALLRYAFNYEGLPVDKEAVEELEISKIDLSNENHRIELKSKIIRLSNGILKRESERVKNIQ
jgi:hypothetical protein